MSLQSISIVIRETCGQYQVFGLRRDHAILLIDDELQQGEAISVALNYARLLEVPARHIYLGRYSLQEWLELGLTYEREKVIG